MSTNWAAIDEIAVSINKKLGESILIKGSDIQVDVPRSTTGILSFDLALGGGWAANQWNEIVGDESSGKTAVAMHAIAVNMKRDPEFIALFVAAEEYVPEYAEAFGIDTDRLWVVETNQMEPALELIIKAVENRAVDMVVIDSIPALVPNEEADKSMDEGGMAVGARLLGKFFRKCAKAQRRSLKDPTDRKCTLIAINQWRDAIGVMFGDPRTTPGGKAKNYFYFTRMEVRRDEWLKEGSAIDKRVGQTIKMRVFKNKTYRPQQVGVVDMYFTDTLTGFHLGDMDVAKDIVDTSLSLDLFEGRYKWNGERIGRSKEDLYSRVREDLTLQSELRNEVINTLYEKGDGDDD